MSSEHRYSPSENSLAAGTPAAATAAPVDLFAGQKKEPAPVPAPPPMVAVAAPAAAATASLAASNGGFPRATLIREGEGGSSIAAGGFGDTIISGTVIVPGMQQNMQPNFGGGGGAGIGVGARRVNAYAAGGGVTDDPYANNAGTHTIYVIEDPDAQNRADNGGNRFGPPPPGQEEEWDMITTTTTLSHRVRILFIFELFICIIAAVSFPYFWMAVIFPPIGYFGARRFSFYPAAVAMVYVFMMLPLHVVDTVLVFKKDADNAKTPGYEHMDDFERFGIGLVTALVMLYHGWVGVQNFKLCTLLRPLTAHQLRQLYEMPPTCGCL